MKTLENAPDILTVYCEHCRRRSFIRPQDKKMYAKLMKRDTLQAHENLYYKVHPKRMQVIM